MKKVSIYTDGACSGNPGPGGWGAILRWGTYEKEISGGEDQTTNNRMELMAAISALQLLKEPCQVDLYTDSTYLRDGITKWLYNWKRNNWQNSKAELVKNSDLWQALDEICQKHQICWHYVKGHAGHEENTRADKLARGAIKHT